MAPTLWKADEYPYHTTEPPDLSMLGEDFGVLDIEHRENKEIEFHARICNNGSLSH
jgi:hypothetical protein